MRERPEHFRYATGYGIVLNVYESWEADLLVESGGIVPRAVILGPRRLEKSTPGRPQWVIYGYADHTNGLAYCIPVSSRLTDDRVHLYLYDEVLNWRFSIDDAGNYELQNTAKGLHIRVQEDGGIIRLDTPSTHIVLNEAEQSVTIDCAGDLEATAGGNATVKATAIKLDGPVEITGALTAKAGVTVTGNVTASGSIVDVAGNTNHHSHS